jgi:hypothetical protein
MRLTRDGKLGINSPCGTLFYCFKKKKKNADDGPGPVTNPPAYSQPPNPSLILAALY